MRGSYCDPRWHDGTARNVNRGSLCGTLKTELVYRQSLATIPAARSAVFEYIEVFYNRKRLHSALGYQSPSTYEACRINTPETAPAA